MDQVCQQRPSTFGDSGPCDKTGRLRPSLGFSRLSPEDMREVRTCRGATNRLGFALNLLLLRLLHCPLPDVTLAPARIVQFVAMPLNIHPDVLVEYSTRRPQTRDEHLVQIRGYLKLRPYSHEEDDPHLAEYLLARARPGEDRPPH